jgi:hypothetical protein
MTTTGRGVRPNPLLGRTRAGKPRSCHDHQTQDHTTAP